MMTEANPAPIRLLIVDDVDEIRGILQTAMDFCPFGSWTVDVEGDSERALARVRETPYDVVLSDFRMGEVDGLEVLTAAALCNPNGRRVLMTGFNEVPAAREELQAARLDAHLQKPFGTKALFDLLQHLVNGSEAELDLVRARTYDTLAGVRREHPVSPPADTRIGASI